MHIEMTEGKGDDGSLISMVYFDLQVLDQNIGG